MKLKINKPVTVITPTIGKETLNKAVLSVAQQTYTNVKHLVVIDGNEFDSKVADELSNYEIERSSGRLTICALPWNTGKNGYYGHRIYAAFSHLLDTDYAMFLDEDNWYEPNHIESLVETLETNSDASFAYSLRSIHDVDGNYLLDDNCESLGKWPIWFTQNKSPSYLIDTSSFIFHRSILELMGHKWHSGWGGDRRWLSSVVDLSNPTQNKNYACSGLHTLCYRLDGNPNSVTKDFFLQGNEHYKKQYGDNFPWNKTLVTN